MTETKLIKTQPCGYRFCRYSFMPEEGQCKGCAINTEKRELDEWIRPFINELNERLKR